MPWFAAGHNTPMDPRLPQDDTDPPGTCDRIDDRAGGPEVAALLAPLPLIAPETRDAAAAVAQRLDLPAGADIFRADDPDNHLYVIASGTIEAIRTSSVDQSEHLLSVAGPGDLVGALAFIDGRGRSASARTQTACVVYRIDPLDLLAAEGGDATYDNLRMGAALSVSRGLREANDRYTASLERELAAARDQKRFGALVTYLIGILSVSAISAHIIATQLVQVDIYSQTFTWLFIGVITLPTVWLMMSSRVRLAEAGLSRSNLWRSSRAGLAACVGVGMIAVAVAAVGARGPNPTTVLAPLDPLVVALYLPSCFLQEFMARGLVQTSLQRFLQDRRGLRSVLLSSVIFAMLHLHFGIMAALVTYAASVVFGLFYLRHHNLAGVTLFHFGVGVAGMVFGIL